MVALKVPPPPVKGAKGIVTVPVVTPLGTLCQLEAPDVEVVVNT
jgi:hypothetical protein